MIACDALIGAFAKGIEVAAIAFADDSGDLQELVVPSLLYRLHRAARLHLERLSSDRDLAVVFQVELRGSTKFMQEFSAAGFAEYLDIIRRTIEDGQKSGAFRTDTKPIVCAKILYGSLDEMVTNWILSANKYPLPPMADEVLKIFLGGLLVK